MLRHHVFKDITTLVQVLKVIFTALIPAALF